MFNTNVYYDSLYNGQLTERESDNIIRQLERIYYSINTAPIVEVNNVVQFITPIQYTALLNRAA